MKPFIYSEGSLSAVSWREADRDYRDTDAGIDETFIVIARNQEVALDGARRWLANRRDENETLVPDDLGLQERVPDWRYANRSYMVLRVS